MTNQNANQINSNKNFNTNSNEKIQKNEQKAIKQQNNDLIYGIKIIGEKNIINLEEVSV
jgi:hypothetical protein